MGEGQIGVGAKKDCYGVMWNHLCETLENFQTL